MLVFSNSKFILKIESGKDIEYHKQLENSLQHQKTYDNIDKTEFNREYIGQKQIKV